jgi:hypothetical protein
MGQVLEHMMHVAAPVVLVKLVPFVHEAQVVTPRELEYFPAKQAVQTVEPLLELKEPVPHSVQLGEPFDEFV